jgi:hypothetical protein
MRSALHSTRNVWLGHLAVMMACLCALIVHAIYRVPVGRLLLVLPWLGVAAMVMTVLNLFVNLLARSNTSPLGRLLEGIDRRSLWLILTFIPASFGASAFATKPTLRFAFLALGVVVATASVAVVVRRVLLDRRTSVTDAIRWLHYAALGIVGAFFLWTLIVLVNGAMDPSAPVEVDSEVLAIVPNYIDLGLPNVIPHTQIDVRSWRSTGAERLVVAGPEYLRVWVGEPIRVELRAGFLGILWVSAVSLDEVRQAKAILEVSPTAFNGLRQLTKGLLLRREYAEGLAVARRHEALYPGDAQYMQFVVGILGNSGRYLDAIELLDPIAARRPDYNTLCMLGFNLDRSGNHHRAIEVLKQAHELRPNDFLALHFLGEANAALERYPEAIAAYEAELVVRPNSPEIRRRARVFREYLARGRRAG